MRWVPHKLSGACSSRHACTSPFLNSIQSSTPSREDCEHSSADFTSSPTTGHGIRRIDYRDFISPMQHPTSKDLVHSRPASMLATLRAHMSSPSQAKSTSGNADCFCVGRSRSTPFSRPKRGSEDSIDDPVLFDDMLFYDVHWMYTATIKGVRMPTTFLGVGHALSSGISVIVITAMVRDGGTISRGTPSSHFENSVSDLYHCAQLHLHITLLHVSTLQV